MIVALPFFQLPFSTSGKAYTGGRLRRTADGGRLCRFSRVRMFNVAGAPAKSASEILEGISAGFSADLAQELRRSSSASLCRQRKPWQAAAELQVEEARNVVTWTALITGYARNGMHVEALHLFVEMLEEGIRPDAVAFTAVLSLCKSELGAQIHAQVVKFGFREHVFVCNALINMYAKSELLEFALQVFDEMPERNVVNWTSMIAEYGRRGSREEALVLFAQMLREGIRPDEHTYTSIASLAGLQEGRQLHGQALKSGFFEKFMVRSLLLRIYAEHGEIDDARQVFKGLHRDGGVVNWTMMINKYAECGNFEMAVKLFVEMQQKEIPPDEFTLTAMLSHSELEQGRQIHASVLKTGLQQHTVVATALVDMYARSAMLQCARKVFDALCERDILTWNTLISAYARYGAVEEAFGLLLRMQELDGFGPDKYTFSALLPRLELHLGRQIHACVVKTALQNIFVRSALVDMYTDAGQVADARKVFETQDTNGSSDWPD